MTFQNETIAAISTPAGSGGIAVVRVSGSNAIAIVDKVFRGNIKWSEAEALKALVSSIERTLKKESGLLDQGLVTG